MDKTKRQFQIELAEALSKNEDYKKEIKQWEVMYKEWMQMMEDRVTNINRTHQILQVIIKRLNLLVKLKTILSIQLKQCIVRPEDNVDQ